MKSATLAYVPIPEEIAEAARRTRVDGFGHRLHVVREKAPCRVCLRISTEPEGLILLSYQPLPDTSPYAEIGPVFIHADRCEPYSHLETFPGDFASRSLVLRAYGREGQIVDAVVAQPGEAPERAAEFLQNPAIAEVHVRHISYTCFDFKILRQPGV
jgi:Protein of unknown function (DUF1203)